MLITTVATNSFGELRLPFYIKDNMKKYKILVPKAGANNEQGTEVKLYQLDELVDANEEWQESLMNAFVSNGWAMEVKVDKPSDQGEPVKRARNDDGTLKGDDPSTPEVNEAWEGGKAPAKKPVRKKRTTKKKS